MEWHPTYASFIGLLFQYWMPVSYFVGIEKNDRVNDSLPRNSFSSLLHLSIALTPSSTNSNLIVAQLWIHLLSFRVHKKKATLLPHVKKPRTERRSISQFYGRKGTLDFTCTEWNIFDFTLCSTHCAYIHTHSPHSKDKNDCNVIMSDGGITCIIWKLCRFEPEIHEWCEKIPFTNVPFEVI